MLGAVGVDDKDTADQFATGWQHINGPGAVKLQGNINRLICVGNLKD